MFILPVLPWIASAIAAVLFGGYMWQTHQPITLAAGYIIRGTAQRFYDRANSLLARLYKVALFEIGCLVALFAVAAFAYLSNSPSLLYGTMALIIPLLFLASLVVAGTYMSLRGLVTGLGRITGMSPVTTAINTTARVVRDMHTGLTMGCLLMASFLAFDYSWGWNFLADWMALICFGIIAMSSATVALAERQIFKIVTYGSMFIATLTLSVLAYMGSNNPAWAHGVAQQWHNTNAKIGKGSQDAAFSGSPKNVGLFLKTKQDTDIIRQEQDGSFSTTAFKLPAGRTCYMGTDQTRKTVEGIDLIRAYCPGTVDASTILKASKSTEWVWLIVEQTEPTTSPLAVKNNGGNALNTGAQAPAAQQPPANSGNQQATFTPPAGSTKFAASPTNTEKVATLQPGDSVTIQWVGGNIKPNTPGYTADYQPNPVHGFGVVTSFTGVLAQWNGLPYKDKSLHATLIVVDDGSGKEVQEFDSARTATVKNTKSVPVTVSLLYNELPEHAKLHTGAEYFSVKKP